MMDNFRSQFGYELGKKTAWFSGKSLLTNRDIIRNKFWKTDYWYNVRYYSTFHIKDDYLKYYIENLIKFKPEYIIGFPTSLDELAKYGKRNNIQFPENMVKAIFTTSETVTKEIRKNIEEFFKANLFNQYSASEGAPIITECLNHRLHLELQSGVFEVLNENNLPSKNGRLVVTSFTTFGTPLIRYDIGDIVELSDEKCPCGNHNPLVKQIIGRIDDYVYSPENGKINLTNIANAIKDINGIIKMQIIQDLINEINIKLVIEENIYKKNSENYLFSNLRDRLGNEMSIKLEYVKDIPVEKSGKYCVVKNNIKHLIEK
jgi:phenylacetate-CoA ligase